VLSVIAVFMLSWHCHWNFTYSLSFYFRMGWCNCQHFYFYDVWFHSLPGHQLSWLRVFMVFLSASGKILGQ